MLMWRTRAWLVALALASSCHRGGGPARDARAEAAASATQRLQGRWVLQSFVPEVPLDLAMQLLLNAQIGRFIAEFRGNHVKGEGPGVTVDRDFRVDEAYVDHFKATVFDAYGLGTESSNDFEGDTLAVNGMTEPWRGHAVFRRVR
jgi:hypothetical protein